MVDCALQSLQLAAQLLADALIHPRPLQESAGDLVGFLRGCDPTFGGAVGPATGVAERDPGRAPANADLGLQEPQLVARRDLQQGSGLALVASDLGRELIHTVILRLIFTFGCERCHARTRKSTVKQ